MWKSFIKTGESTDTVKQIAQIFIKIGDNCYEITDGWMKRVDGGLDLIYTELKENEDIFIIDNYKYIDSNGDGNTDGVEKIDSFYFKYTLGDTWQDILEGIEYKYKDQFESALYGQKGEEATGRIDFNLRLDRPEDPQFGIQVLGPGGTGGTYPKDKIDFYIKDYAVALDSSFLPEDFEEPNGTDNIYSKTQHKKYSNTPYRESYSVFVPGLPVSAGEDPSKNELKVSILSIDDLSLSNGYITLSNVRYYASAMRTPAILFTVESDIGYYSDLVGEYANNDQKASFIKIDYHNRNPYRAYSDLVTIKSVTRDITSQMIRHNYFYYDHTTGILEYEVRALEENSSVIKFERARWWPNKNSAILDSNGKVIGDWRITSIKQIELEVAEGEKAPSASEGDGASLTTFIPSPNSKYEVIEVPTVCIKLTGTSPLSSAIFEVSLDDQTWKTNYENLFYHRYFGDIYFFLNGERDDESGELITPNEAEVWIAEESEGETAYYRLSGVKGSDQIVHSITSNSDYYVEPMSFLQIYKT